MSATLNTRRWQRQEVDLPVCVAGFNGTSGPVVRGRATEISEGGMAVYAGVDLKPNDLMQVEFQAPRTRLTAVVRNRSGYCFGLEFLTPLPVDGEQNISTRQSPRDPASAPEPNLTSPAAQRISKEAQVAKGSAVAYLVMAKVLQNAGKQAEAQKALEQALVCFVQSRNAHLKAKEIEMNRLRAQIDALRTVTPLLQDSQRQDRVDPRVADILRALPTVLNQNK
jgi:hypothetical protein